MPTYELLDVINEVQQTLGEEKERAMSELSDQRKTVFDEVLQPVPRRHDINAPKSCGCSPRINCRCIQLPWKPAQFIKEQQVNALQIAEAHILKRTQDYADLLKRCQQLEMREEIFKFLLQHGATIEQLRAVYDK